MHTMKNIPLVFILVFTLSACWNTNSSDEHRTDDDEPTTQTDDKKENNNIDADHKADVRNPAVDPAIAQWLCVPGKQVGRITANSTEADIIKSYGTENVVKRDVAVGERQIAKGTVVYPDSENELIVIWKEGQEFQKPASVKISKENASWQTSQGIKIGTPIERLIQVNGKDFEFHGFEWDHAGLVTSWNDGNISSDFYVYLSPDNIDAVLPEIIGDGKFSSNHPKVADGNIKVAQMIFYFNE